MYCGCPCGPVGFRGMSAYGYVGTFPPYPDVELNLSFKSISQKKKEESTMNASYKGFSGEVVKLELKRKSLADVPLYDLSIYDAEHIATHSFTSVPLSDVKFSGSAVTFG